MNGSRLAVALGVAAALAAAPRAGAQPAAVPLPPPPPGTTLVVPATSPARGAGWVGLAAGPYAAFERGRSIALVLDYGIPRAPWGRLEVEWHLAIVAANPGEETGLNRLQPSPGYGVPAMTVPSGVENASALVIEVVPMARLRYPIVPGFGLVIDGGVGVCQTFERYERDEMFVGRSEQSKNVTGVVLRAGLGVAVDFTPRLRLLFEPVAFSAQLGADYSGFTPLLGLAYRL
ncbi:MAG TPA: hypothetical protein VLC54_21320 [Anaeromyxobacter sp.]|nr:hypothetical protein [Anaeromyxobacter sp.]